MKDLAHMREEAAKNGVGDAAEQKTDGPNDADERRNMMRIALVCVCVSD